MTSDVIHGDTAVAELKLGMRKLGPDQAGRVIHGDTAVAELKLVQGEVAHLGRGGRYP